MRKWNKLLAMVLAMVMVFGLAATSFAAENDDEDTAPVTDTTEPKDEAESEEDKTEAEGEEDKTDAEGEEDKTDAEGEEDKTDAEGEEDKTDAEGEEDKTDAEGEEDKTDAEGEEDKTDAEGEEDKTDAEGEEDKTDDTAPVEIDYTGVDEWALEYVKHVVGELGLIVSRETGLEPTAVMTRGEMVDALYKLAESPEVEGENKFADVADDAFYKDAVLWAVSNEIVNGVSGAHFDPDGQLTRQEIAVFFYRYAKYAGIDVAAEDGNLDRFADLDTLESWAETEMNWAVAKELVNGTSGSKLEPASPATRQEVAALLSRYITNILDAAEAPADDAAEPTDDASEPTDDVAEPTDDASEPADDATEPADDATEPTDDAAEPTEDENKDEDQADDAEGNDAADSTEGEAEGDEAASDDAGDDNADDADAGKADDAE